MVINISDFKQTGEKKEDEASETDEGEKSLPVDNKVDDYDKKIKINNKIGQFISHFIPIPLSEKLFFVQYLGIMLKAGISLSIALKTLAKQTNNKRFANIISDISNNVEKGGSFTESLKPHEKIFGQLFVSMIESGEISGKLEEVLNRSYIQLKKQHELISKVRGALTYPIVIVMAMIGIGIFMMIMVVPRITNMFKDFKAELPLPTKILIKLSDSLINHGLLVSLAIIILIIIIIQILRTKKGKYVFQAIVLNLPIFSPIVKKVNLARFSRTISSLLKTDIMVIKSFQITAKVLGNLHYRKALNEMSEKIKGGGTIYNVITNYPKLFPPVVTQIVSVGEETGELDSILEELAQFYEGEVDQIMNNLPSIIEPLLILVLGAVVGGMAVAIIMPMYSLTTAI